MKKSFLSMSGSFEICGFGCFLLIRSIIFLNKQRLPCLDHFFSIVLSFIFVNYNSVNSVWIFCF